MIKWSVRVLAMAASMVLGAALSWDVLYELATPVGSAIGGGEIRDPGPMALMASGFVFIAILCAGGYAGVVLSNRLSSPGQRGR